MKGRGIPTTGARFMAMRIFMVNWIKMIDAIPKAIREPTWSDVF
jgi:hypothetical protein